MSLTLSIITCTWNSEKYLPESINSVLKQDYSNIEYIFVDGGSTDKTLDLINAVPRPVKLLENVTGGIARAMNEGIRVATGDVVAHIHSDDYYLGSDTLSLVAETFESTQCKWLFGRIMSDLDGALQAEGYEVPRYTHKRFLHRNFLPHPATFIQRNVFNEVGVFSEKLRYAMDYDLFLRIANRYTPQQLDKHIAAFRRHDGSTTQANQLKSFLEDYQVRCSHAPWLERPEMFARFLIRKQRLQASLAAQGL